MNTNMELRAVTIPSPRDFAVAWGVFFQTISAIATYRANSKGPSRFGELSIHAAELLVEAGNSEELLSCVEKMANDKYEKVVLGILYEEMLFVSWRYRNAFNEADLQIPEAIWSMGDPGNFHNEIGHPGDEDAIEIIETVAGSIQSLLDKLPSWIRKGVEAIMEVLKLTRGESN